MSKESRRWCSDCDRNVLARMETPSFQDAQTQGCIILLTCGLAMPFMLLNSIFNGPAWRCTVCGKKC